MVEPLGFEPKSYEFTLVLIVVETFLSPEDASAHISRSADLLICDVVPCW